jgi:hypothetical protein
MEWEVEFTDEFFVWWNGLDADEQDSVIKLPNMRELRVQHEGRPYRVLYAFDPRRVGILLLGGDKTGNVRWYKEYVPKADVIYRQHLRELEDSKR